MLKADESILTSLILRLFIFSGGMIPDELKNNANTSYRMV